MPTMAGVHECERVTAFFDIFFRRSRIARHRGVRIAAVGPATAAKLRELHLQVDLTPDEFTAKKSPQRLKIRDDENLKMCLLRRRGATPDLPEGAGGLGAIVDDIAIYKTVAETEDPAGTWATLLEKRRGLDHLHERLDGGTFSRAFRLPEMFFSNFGRSNARENVPPSAAREGDPVRRRFQVASPCAAGSSVSATVL